MGLSSCNIKGAKLWNKNFTTVNSYLYITYFKAKVAKYFIEKQEYLYKGKLNGRFRLSVGAVGRACAFSWVAPYVGVGGIRMGPSTEDRGNKLTGAKVVVGIDSRSVAAGLVRVRSVPARVPRGSLPLDRGCGLLCLWPGRMPQFIRFGEFLWWSLMNCTEISLWWRIWITRRPLTHYNFVYWSHLKKIVKLIYYFVYGVDMKSCHETLFTDLIHCMRTKEVMLNVSMCRIMFMT